LLLLQNEKIGKGNIVTNTNNFFFFCEVCQKILEYDGVF
jgi:hypothetical protein